MARWRGVDASLERSKTMSTGHNDDQPAQIMPLDQIQPLVIIDDEGRVTGVLLAQSRLAPADLYERLCERAESWLASGAGAELRAQALEEALRVGGLSAADLRLDRVTVLGEMLPRAELGPDMTAARLILEEDAYHEILLEDEGVPVLFSADADGADADGDSPSACSRTPGTASENKTCDVFSPPCTLGTAAPGIERFQEWSARALAPTSGSGRAASFPDGSRPPLVSARLPYCILHPCTSGRARHPVKMLVCGGNRHTKDTRACS
jgi:hypothetical protein